MLLIFIIPYIRMHYYFDLFVMAKRNQIHNEKTKFFFFILLLHK